jgi:hypothetical protein
MRRQQRGGQQRRRTVIATGTSPTACEEELRSSSTAAVAVGVWISVAATTLTRLLGGPSASARCAAASRLLAAAS